MVNQVENVAAAGEVNGGSSENIDVWQTIAAQAHERKQVTVPSRQADQLSIGYQAYPENLAIAAQDMYAYGCTQADLDNRGIKIQSLKGTEDSAARWSNEMSATFRLLRDLPAKEIPAALNQANALLKESGLHFELDDYRNVYFKDIGGASDFGTLGTMNREDRRPVLTRAVTYRDPEAREDLREKTAVTAFELEEDARKSVAAIFAEHYAMEAGMPVGAIGSGETNQAWRRQSQAIDRMGLMISGANPDELPTALAGANSMLKDIDLRFAVSPTGYVVLMNNSDPVWTLAKPGVPYVVRHWGRKE